MSTVNELPSVWSSLGCHGNHYGKSWKTKTLISLSTDSSCFALTAADLNNIWSYKDKLCWINNRNGGIILHIGSANERCCFIVMSSLIGSGHIQNDPWLMHLLLQLSATSVIDWPMVTHRILSTIKLLILGTPNPNTLNVSHLILQLSLPNPLKPDVKLRMKM